MSVSQLQPQPAAQVQHISKSATAKDATFLSLKLLNKRSRVRLSPQAFNLDPFPGKAHLFAVANSKGWFVAATRVSEASYALVFSTLSDLRAAFISGTSSSEETHLTPRRTFTIDTAIPNLLVFALNETRLLVGLTQGPITVFDTAHLFSSGSDPIPPLHVFQSPSGTPPRLVLPNPGDTPALVAVLREQNTNDATAQTVEVLSLETTESVAGWRGGNTPETTPTTLSWSPKGKQLAIGLLSGSILAFSPTAPHSPKSHIPPPPSSTSPPQSIVSTTWLFPALHHTIYTPLTRSGPDQEQTHYLLSLDAKSNTATDIRLNPPCLPFPGMRPPSAFSLVLRNWGPAKVLLIVGDSASSDIGALVCSPTDEWSGVSLDENAQPSMPLDKELMDTVLVGLELDLTKQECGEGEPIMYAYASDGTITGWYMSNADGGEYPGMIGAHESVQSPASAMVTPTNSGSGFGQLSLGSAFVQHSGSSSFEQPSAPSLGSTFSQSSFGQPPKFGQSAFEQPSTFGQSSSFSQQSTSAFGTSFGQRSPFVGPSSSPPSSPPQTFTGGFSAYASTAPTTFGQQSLGFGFGSTSPTATSAPNPAPPIITTSPPAPQMQRDDSMSGPTPSTPSTGLSFGSMSLGTTPALSPSSPTTPKSGIFGQSAPPPLPLPPDHPPNQPSDAFGLIRPATGFGAFGGGAGGGPFSGQGGAFSSPSPSVSQPTVTMTSATPPAFGKSGFEVARVAPQFGQSGFGQTPSFGKSSFASTPPQSASASGGNGTNMSGGFGAFAQGGPTGFAAALGVSGFSGDSKPVWASRGGSQHAANPPFGGSESGSAFGRTSDDTRGSALVSAVSSGNSALGPVTPLKDISLSSTTPKSSAIASPPSSTENSPSSRPNPSPSQFADSPFKSSAPAPSTGAFGGLKTSASGFFKPATGFGAFSDPGKKTDSPFYNPPQNIDKSKPVSVFASLSSPPKSGSTTPTFGTPSALGNPKPSFGSVSAIGGVRSTFTPSMPGTEISTVAPTIGGFSAFSGTVGNAFAAYAGPQKSFGDLLKGSGDGVKDPEKPQVASVFGPSKDANDAGQDEGHVSLLLNESSEKPVTTLVGTSALRLGGNATDGPPLSDKGKGEVAALASGSTTEHAPREREPSPGSDDVSTEHPERLTDGLPIEKDAAAPPPVSEELSFGSSSLSSQSSSFVEVSDHPTEQDAEGEAEKDLDGTTAPEDNTHLFLSDDGFSEPDDASVGLNQSDDEDDDEQSSRKDPANIPLPSTPQPSSRSPSATPKPEAPVIRVTPLLPPRSPSPLDNELSSNISEPREESTTPPGSPVEEHSPAPLASKSPSTPSPVAASPVPPFGIGLGRPSTRPTRSSPLATAPLSLDEETLDKDVRTKKPSAPKPQPAAPKPVFGLWSPPAKMEVVKASDAEPSRPKTPPLLTSSGVSSSVSSGAPLVSTASTIKQPSSSPFTPTPLPILPPFSLGSSSSPLPFTLQGLPSNSPATSFGFFGSKPASPSPNPPAPKVILPPAPMVSRELEEGMQAECAHLCSSLARELQQLEYLAEETSQKTAVFNKPYFGVRTKADLGDSSKWGLADVHIHGQTMKQLANDVDELEVKRNLQLNALKGLESDILKAGTRKEEIARFNKAKTDTEFAKMLKVRTLGPEHLETQSQLRRDIWAMRDRVQKLEAHLQASKKKLHQLRSGKPSIRAPSLDTISRTFRNIDVVIDQLSVSIASLTARVSKLGISSSSVLNTTSSRDARLPNNKSTRRPFNVTPSVAATTAAALNAERSAHKLKRALLAVRQEPLLNTKVSSAAPVPATFETLQRASTKREPLSPGSMFGSSHTLGGLSDWSLPPLDSTESPSSSKSRRGGGVKLHSKPVQLKKSTGTTSLSAAPAFDWGTVPKIAPMRLEGFTTK